MNTARHISRALGDYLTAQDQAERNVALTLTAPAVTTKRRRPVPLERDPRQVQLFPVARTLPAGGLRPTARQAEALDPLFGGDEGKQGRLA